MRDGTKRRSAERRAARWPTALVAIGAGTTAGIVGATAWACPSCPAALTARQQVFEQDFASNLLFSLAPFLLVAIVCGWVERLGKPPKRSPEGTT